MSRTWKDAPYAIKAYRKRGRAIPANWKDQNSWKSARAKGLSYEEWHQWFASRPRLERHEVSYVAPGLRSEACTYLERKYRSHVRQMMAQERYDDIRRTRKCAIWELL